MRQSTKRFASLVVSLALLFGAAIMYFNFIVPAYNDLESLRQDEASRAQFVQNEQAAVQKVQDLISTYEGQTGIQDTISQALPPAPDVSGALLELNGIAQITGVAVQQFSVSQALSASSPPAPAASQNAGNSPAGPLSGLAAPLGTLTFQVQFQGTYENFKQFLEDVETNIRIFNVQSVTIQPSTAATGSRGAGDNFSYNLTVVAYYQGVNPPNNANQ